jgi:choline dehydrogenase-like flavoprotein
MRRTSARCGHQFRPESGISVRVVYDRGRCRAGMTCSWRARVRRAVRWPRGWLRTRPDGCCCSKPVRTIGLDQLPADVANGWEVAYAPDWGFVTVPDGSGRSINAWRGRLVGGCSALNATIALRGHPRDCDAWSTRGNWGWPFADVLPFFRRLETDADFHDEWHGSDGPLPIRRYAPDELSPAPVGLHGRGARGGL